MIVDETLPNISMHPRKRTSGLGKLQRAEEEELNTKKEGRKYMPCGGRGT